MAPITQLRSADTVEPAARTDTWESPDAAGGSRRSALLSAVVAAGAAATFTSQAALASVFDEQAAIRVFEQAARSAVYIGNFEVDGSGNESKEAVGSGVVWNDLGYIVTNYHVVTRLAENKGGRQRARVQVQLADGTVAEYEAKVAGLDSATDIAVLKIDAPPEALVPARIGTSNDIKVGQMCFAIGNPFGLSSTLTAGLVSGVNRTIPSPSGNSIKGVIQTDAAINAGNSGGPLLDSFGRVIGINTATFTRQGTGMSSGVNFALPINLVYSVVPEIVLNYKESS